MINRQQTTRLREAHALSYEVVERFGLVGLREYLRRPCTCTRVTWVDLPEVAWVAMTSVRMATSVLRFEAEEPDLVAHGGAPHMVFVYPEDPNDTTGTISYLHVQRIGWAVRDVLDYTPDVSLYGMGDWSLPPDRGICSISRADMAVDTPGAVGSRLGEVCGASLCPRSR
jgi:hypothetical protein